MLKFKNNELKILDYYIPQDMKNNQNFKILVFEIQNSEHYPKKKGLHKHKRCAVGIMSGRKNKGRNEDCPKFTSAYRINSGHHIASKDVFFHNTGSNRSNINEDGILFYKSTQIFRCFG